MQITDERRDNKYEMMRVSGGIDKGGDVLAVRKKNREVQSGIDIRGTQREGGGVGDLQKGVSEDLEAGVDAIIRI